MYIKTHPDKSKFPIGGVSFFSDSFVVTASSVIQLNIYTKMLVHSKSAHLNQQAQNQL